LWDEGVVNRLRTYVQRAGVNNVVGEIEYLLSRAFLEKKKN
jgi:hypothetical protein